MRMTKQWTDHFFGIAADVDTATNTQRPNPQRMGPKIHLKRPHTTDRSHCGIPSHAFRSNSQARNRVRDCLSAGMLGAEGFRDDQGGLQGCVPLFEVFSYVRRFSSFQFV
jgi:hypothetical protein